ncbi:MAG: hypothetical protein WCO82_06260 [Sphingomonadales bacterium]|jgi:hypothetical protein
MAIDPATVEALVPIATVALIAGPAAWVITTWMKIKNGYPLENSWGKPLYPNASNETTERVKLLSQENAQLRAELGSMKDRLAVLERIATDKPTLLAAEIDRLSGPLN